MVPSDLFPWIVGPFGAVVVLALGNWIFYRLYREERARNSALVDRFAAVTEGGNDGIRDLTDAVADAIELAKGSPPTSRLRPRRRGAG